LWASIERFCGPVTMDLQRAIARELAVSDSVPSTIAILDIAENRAFVMIWMRGLSGEHLQQAVFERFDDVWYLDQTNAGPGQIATDVQTYESYFYRVEHGTSSVELTAEYVASDLVVLGELQAFVYVVPSSRTSPPPTPAFITIDGETCAVVPGTCVRRMYLIDQYLAYGRSADERQQWAFDAFNNLVVLDPDFAWQLTLEAIDAASEEDLAFLAAGPLEDLLDVDEKYGADVDVKAENSPKLRTALGLVWR
jgi:hypothetical protein